MKFWIAVVLAGHWVSAGQYSLEECKVSFLAVGSPVVVKIAGTAKSGCTGVLEVDGSVVKKGSFDVKLDSLNTGIRLRNKHLKENYLEIAKYPESKLVLKQASEVAEQLAGKKNTESNFSGELNLHGQTKNVNGSYIIENKKVTAKFSFKLTEFEIKPPAFMGVTVADHVDVTVNFALKGGQ